MSGGGKEVIDLTAASSSSSSYFNPSLLDPSLQQLRAIFPSHTLPALRAALEAAGGNPDLAVGQLLDSNSSGSASSSGYATPPRPSSSSSSSTAAPPAPNNPQPWHQQQWHQQQWQQPQWQQPPWQHRHWQPQQQPQQWQQYGQASSSSSSSGGARWDLPPPRWLRAGDQFDGWGGGWRERNRWRDEEVEDAEVEVETEAEAPVPDEEGDAAYEGEGEGEEEGEAAYDEPLAEEWNEDGAEEEQPVAEDAAHYDAQEEVDQREEELFGVPAPPPPPPPPPRATAPFVEIEEDENGGLMGEVGPADEEDEVAVDASEIELARLAAILPDCDLDHLKAALQATYNDSNLALERILSARDPYPKRRPKEAPEQSEVAKNSDKAKAAADELWLDPTKSAAAALTGGRLQEYRNDAITLLAIDFPNWTTSSLLKVLASSRNLYAVAWKFCADAWGEVIAQKPLREPLRPLRAPRSKNHARREQVSSKVIKEERKFVAALRHTIFEALDREKAHATYVAECEKNGLVLECECCFNECIAEDMIQCAHGHHLFCKSCAKRFMEGWLGGENQNKLELACPSMGGCTAILPKSELMRVLPPELMDKYEEQVTKATIEKALLRGDLTGVERCPFCDFAMEMAVPPEVNKVFHCFNESCGKESCRLCKEPSHLPYKCSEVEKQDQTKYRLTVEEKMTEALVRECLACKAKGILSRFVKEDGCNKMTCPKCRGYVCYQCNAQIDRKVAYGHFCDHPRTPGKPCTKCTKCDLWTGNTVKDLQRIEAKRVREAGMKAKDDAYDDLAILKEDEEAADEGAPRRKHRRRH